MFKSRLVVELGMTNRTYGVGNSSKFEDHFRRDFRQFSVSQAGKNYTYLQTVGNLDKDSCSVDIYDNEGYAIIVRNNAVTMIGDNRTQMNSMRRDLIRRMGVDLQII